jgi:hypothetical protein
VLVAALPVLVLSRFMRIEAPDNAVENN